MFLFVAKIYTGVGKSRFRLYYKSIIQCSINDDTRISSVSCTHDWNATSAHPCIRHSLFTPLFCGRTPCPQFWAFINKAAKNAQVCVSEWTSAFITLGQLSRSVIARSYKFMFNFLKRLYLFIFRERGREGEREGEKHRSVASRRHPNWD